MLNLVGLSAIARAALALRDVRFWASAVLTQVDRINEELDTIRTRLASGEPAGSYSFRVQWESDRHHLVIAADHLHRAIERVGRFMPVRLSRDVAAAVTVMRDLYEHWENQEAAFSDPPAAASKAAKRYLERWPDLAPQAIEWHDATGLRIGSLNVAALVDDVFHVREFLYSIEVIPLGGDDV